jgi:hypothetical protein
VGWFGLEPSWEDIPYAIHLPAADLGAMYGYDVQWFCADEPSMAPQYAALTPMPPGLKLQPGGLIWGRATALSDGGPYEFEIEATVNPSGATHVQNFLLNVVEPGSGDGG